MNQQSSRIHQEYRTALEPNEVLARAKRFFQSQIGIYAAFFEKEGPRHVVFRGQGGEELVVGVLPIAGGTLVTAGTYLFDVQVARFFTSLDPHVEPFVDSLESGDAAALPAGAVPDADGGAAT